MKPKILGDIHHARPHGRRGVIELQIVGAQLRARGQRERRIADHLEESQPSGGVPLAFEREHAVLEIKLRAVGDGRGAVLEGAAPFQMKNPAGDIDGAPVLIPKRHDEVVSLRGSAAKNPRGGVGEESAGLPINRVDVTLHRDRAAILPLRGVDEVERPVCEIDVRA